LQREFAALEKNAAQDFRRENWQGRVHYARSVDLRYHGQGYELNLPFTRNLFQDFTHEHQRRYGYTHTNREIEIVTLRLRATLKSATADVGTGTPARSGRARLGRVSSPDAAVLFDTKKLKTKIYSRDQLRPSKKYSGPAIITEYSATTVIPPGTRFQVDRAGNLIVRV
jgi:N-methylhydantoinase A